MKERKIDTLMMPWVNARVAHLLSVQRAAATMVDNQTTGESGPDRYHKVVITKDAETVDVFFLLCDTCEGGEGLHRGAH